MTKFLAYLTSFSHGGRLSPAFSALVPACLLLVLLAAPSAPAESQLPKNVLILHSYHNTLEWTVAIDQGIRETFRDAPVNLRFEYMDTKRIYNKNYLGLLLATYRHKFAGEQFDAILSSDNNALKFLVRHGEALFPGVPVVFCGVNNFRDEMLQGKPGFTGAVEKPAFRETLELALKLTPRMRSVYIFGADTPTYFANKALLSKLIPHFQDRLEFHFIDGKSVEEVEREIGKLPGDAILFQVGIMRDKDGRLLSFQESTRRESQAGHIPSYGSWSYQLGHGIIGGRLINGHAQGKAAARLVLRILGGEAVEEIPLLRDSPNRYMFDHVQLKRFGIAESALPPDSTVINRPASMLVEHGEIILPGAVITAILALAVVLLSITIGKGKKAEQRALRSERLYHSIFDNAVEGIFQSTLEGRFLRLNPAMAKIYGYECPEEMVHTVTNIATQLYTDQGDRERILELLSREGHTTGVELRHRRKDGEIIWIGLTIAKVFDPERKEYIFEGIVEDITAQKKTQEIMLRESTLNKAQTEILRTLTQPGSTMESVSQVVHKWAMETTGSRYGCVLSRSSKEEKIAIKNISFLIKKCPFRGIEKECVDPLCSQDHMLQPLLDIRTGMYANTPDALHASLGIWPLDPIQRLLTAPAIYMEEHMGQIILGNPERDFTDSDLRAAATLADLFALAIHRMQSEQDMLLAREKAEAASKAKSEFLANMSHELRTPINGALGMLQLLHGTNPSKEQTKYIDTGIRSCRNLTSLLHDILDLSRVETGMLSLHEEAFDIQTLMDSVQDTFTELAREKGLGIETCVAKNIPAHLLGDPTRIRQVLFNLVGNAVKFTEQGEVRIEVHRLSPVDMDRTRLCFTVSDTGIGIPERFRQTIFNSFTQVERSYTRQRQGAGLGLSIVKRLVALMGGTVDFSSREGHGSTFRLELPLKTAPQPPSTQTPQRPPALPCPLVSKRILVAEDDVSNRLMLKMFLSKQGFDVTCVEDGKKVLHALEQSAYDCVLMDIQMPEMDGVTATRTIRGSTGLGEKARTPIVAITAYAMKGDRQTFLDAGMDEYLSKPVDMQELLHILGRLCP